jgi:hypothetical protein
MKVTYSMMPVMDRLFQMQTTMHASFSFLGKNVFMPSISFQALLHNHSSSVAFIFAEKSSAPEIYLWPLRNIIPSLMTIHYCTLQGNKRAFVKLTGS